MTVGHPPEPGLPSSPHSFPACIRSPSPSLALPDARKNKDATSPSRRWSFPFQNPRSGGRGNWGFQFWELTWVSRHFPWPWAVTFHSNHFTKQSLVKKQGGGVEMQTCEAIWGITADTSVIDYLAPAYERAQGKTENKMTTSTAHNQGWPWRALKL